MCLDHHHGEYFGMAKLSSPTYSVAWCRDYKKNPHRAKSLCCHEPNDGRKTKQDHTPSIESKATEPSQLQPDTPKDAPAHRSVSWTKTQKRLPAGQRRQDEQRQEKKGRTGNKETPTPAWKREEHTEQKRTSSPRSRRRQEDTIPPGTTRKDTQKEQTKCEKSSYV